MFLKKTEETGPFKKNRKELTIKEFPLIAFSLRSSFFVYKKASVKFFNFWDLLILF